MRCSACGKEMMPGGSFCPECGIRVRGETPEKEVAPAPEPADVETAGAPGGTKPAPPAPGTVGVAPPPVPTWSLPATQKPGMSGWTAPAEETGKRVAKG